MKTGMKFGNDERNPVVQRIETLKNIKLTPVGSKRKFFAGSDGSYYCILAEAAIGMEFPKK